MKLFLNSTVRQIYSDSWNCWLILSCLWFLAYRFVVLGLIFVERSLPMEVDDALIYSLHIKIAGLPTLVDNLTFASSRALSEKIALATESHLAFYASQYTKGGAYFAYTHFCQAVSSFFDIRLFDLMIFNSFFLQPLYLLSFVFFSKICLKIRSHILALAVFIFAFTTLENVHVLTATPFSFSTCFLLIGATTMEQKKYLASTIFLLLSIFFHTGAFLGVFCIFIINLRNQLTGTEHFDITALARRTLAPQTAIPVVCVLLSFFIHFVSSSFLDIKPLMNFSSSEIGRPPIYNLLFSNALAGFKDVVVFFDKFTLIYFTLPLLTFIYITEKTAPNLKLMLFCWGITWSLSLLHHMPSYPGGLTAYLLQYFAVFISIYLAYLIFSLHELHLTGFLFAKNPLPSKIFKRAAVITPMVVIGLSFFILTLENTIKQISHRSERHNFVDISDKLAETDNLFPKNIPLVVFDKMSFLFALYSVRDRELKYLNPKDILPWSLAEVCSAHFLQLSYDTMPRFCGKKYKSQLVWSESPFKMNVMSRK